ncbi:MAG: GNAT family N-acetyltransferase [Anaerolineae bacterium]
MSEPLRLVRPSLRYKDSYIAAAYEYEAEGHWPLWNIDKMIDHFDEYVEMLLLKETEPMPGWAAETVFWSVVGEAFVGRITLRHELLANLINYGGHIGYDVRPTMRRHGYGTQQLALCLVEARQRGFERVLITCDDDNVGSIRIIEANGGVLEDKRDNGRHALTRRYWITL